MQRTWSLEEIRHKIATNDTWLCRGIIAIYQQQTMDEKRNRTTSEPNGFGFNLKDSFIMSTLAEQLLRGRAFKVSLVFPFYLLFLDFQ